jgi:hypothetical protein
MTSDNKPETSKTTAIRDLVSHEIDNVSGGASVKKPGWTDPDPDPVKPPNAPGWTDPNPDPVR